MEVKPGRSLILGLAVFSLAGSGGPARAQEQPETPRAEASAAPLPEADPSGSTDDRLLRLEALNQKILDRLDRAERDRQATEERYRSLEARYEALKNQVERPSPGGAPSFAEAEGGRFSSGEAAGVERIGEGRGRRGVSRGEEPFANRKGDWLEGHEAEERPLRATLGEGFGIKSLDDEYQLRFRILDQTDFKVFSPNNQVPASSGIYIPRVRVYFEGQLTKLFEYEVSVQRSVEGVWDLLDGNVNIRPDQRFQVRFGRMLVPYSYDWYDHLEQFFITPERALFPLNFGLSRSAGLLAHGRLFDDRLQYAAGGYDGHLVGVADNNSTRDMVGYLNARPFANSERFPLLRDFNVGISGYVGQQIRPQQPLPLRTSLQSSENDEAAELASSIFLRANEDVFLLGNHNASALHVAWYARGFSLEVEWQGGRDHYQRAGTASQVSVPVTGSHYTLSYFLTGEEVSGRGMVNPLRPFDPYHNQWGPGAFELFARYSELGLGETIFTAGLANPRDWTRSIGLIDLGVNWYLTRYIKIYLDWQHSSYGSPVLLNPAIDLYSRDNDLFWIRGQLYY